MSKNDVVKCSEMMASMIPCVMRFAPFIYANLPKFLQTSRTYGRIGSFYKTER